MILPIRLFFCATNDGEEAALVSPSICMVYVDDGCFFQGGVIYRWVVASYVDPPLEFVSSEDAHDVQPCSGLARS